MRTSIDEASRGSGRTTRLLQGMLSHHNMHRINLHVFVTQTHNQALGALSLLKRLCPDYDRTYIMVCTYRCAKDWLRGHNVFFFCDHTAAYDIDIVDASGHGRRGHPYGIPCQPITEYNEQCLDQSF